MPAIVFASGRSGFHAKPQRREEKFDSRGDAETRREDWVGQRLPETAEGPNQLAVVRHRSPKRSNLRVSA